MSELPAPPGWRYEPKWDGFRGVLENDGGELALWSRNGRPLLRYFPELRPLGELLPPHSALDGEIVISRDGQARLRRDADAPASRREPRPQAAGEIPATFVAFDLLLWNREEPVHEQPIEKRRAELERVGDGFSLSPVSADVEQGRDWLQTLQAAGFDGVDREAARSALSPRVARRRREGEAAQDGGLRRRRPALEGRRARARSRRCCSACTATTTGTRLRRLVRVGAKTSGRDRGEGSAAARREERPPLLRAEPLGRGRARGGAAEAGARRRGPLRQAREAPLPPRHEAHPLPARTRIPASARGARCARRAGRTTSRSKTFSPSQVSCLHADVVAR